MQIITRPVTVYTRVQVDKFLITFKQVIWGLDLHSSQEKLMRLTVVDDWIH